MIGKLFRFALKILPIITLYKGITSGGARLKPMVDMVRVTLTQYEVAEITKLIVNDYKKSNGALIDPRDFSAFVRDQFHSQYSVVARELAGDKTHDLSRDIWGVNFALIPNADITNVKIASPGPDKSWDTKDDISVDFNINRGNNRGAASNMIADNTQYAAPGRNPNYDESQYDEYGFDRDGFDREGYDQDGFDRNGMHRDEMNYEQEYNN